MRRASVPTLKDLMAEYQATQTSMQSSVIDAVFDQFISQILPTTGFIWGSSVWGVDPVDSEMSDMASQYSLN